MLVAVNVTDVYNPNIIMKYNVEEENTYDISCLDSLDYCYLPGTNGVRILPIKN